MGNQESGLGRAIALAAIVIAAPLDADAAGAWVELGPVIVARQEVAAAALGGRIYLIGGIEAGNTATVEEFDPPAGRWSLVATLPGILHHTAAVAHGDWIYLIGGYDTLNFRPTAVVRRFDPSRGIFETLPPLPSPSAAHTAGLVDGKIYVAGGAQQPSRLLSYDPETRLWTTLAPMPTPREHLASAVIGGRFYVVGGRIGGVITGALESYDPKSGLWATHPAMPTARGGLGAAAVFERLYVFGGEGNRASPLGVFAQTESFDPASGQWQAEPDMPVPRHGIAAVTLGARIHIPAGAPTEGFGRTTLHDAFDPSPLRRLRPVRRAAP